MVKKEETSKTGKINWKMTENLLVGGTFRLEVVPGYVFIRSLKQRLRNVLFLYVWSRAQLSYWSLESVET